MSWIASSRSEGFRAASIVNIFQVWASNHFSSALRPNRRSQSRIAHATIASQIVVKTSLMRSVESSGVASSTSCPSDSQSAATSRTAASQSGWTSVPVTGRALKAMRSRPGEAPMPALVVKDLRVLRPWWWLILPGHVLFAANGIVSPEVFFGMNAGLAWEFYRHWMALLVYETVMYQKNNGGLRKVPSEDKNLDDSWRVQMVMQMKF